jgi:predicted dehydrogenase
MSESKTVNLGQIGCGYWGPNLLRNFATLPGCRIIALAEQAEARRVFVKDKFPDVETTPDYHALLADETIDGIVLATPAATHGALALEVLRAGKHVFVEKPLAMSSVEAEAIRALSMASGLIAMVGHTFLYNNAVRWIKDYLDAGELGDLYYIYCQRLNLGQLRSDVNAWWNLAPHDVSIVQYLVGGTLPSKVSAHGHAFIQPGVHDVVFATMTWEERKVMAHIHVSWLDPHRTRKVTLVGSKKMLIYDDAAADKVVIYDKGFDKIPKIGEQMDYDLTAFRTSFSMRSGGIIMPSVEVPEPLRAEAAHFVECIRTGSEPLTGAAHGCDVVRILEMGDISLRINS